MSLQKMLVEEHAGSVLYRSEHNPYFHTDSKLFPATEFLVEVLQHLPDPGTRRNMLDWTHSGFVFLALPWHVVSQESQQSS